MTQQRQQNGFFARAGVLFLYGGLAAFFTTGFYNFWMERILNGILSQHQPEAVNTAMSMATHIPVWFMLAVSAALTATGVLIFICEFVVWMIAKVMRPLRLREQANAEVQP